MFEKKNFQNGEKVWICNLGDGKQYSGKVVGKSFTHIFDSYIVETEGRPFGDIYNWDCVNIAESCLIRKSS